ncbi:hypothetical protein [Leptolyngbya sp. FACHB-16]|uniref:tetratricopeptide repeat protein n=1 Tax=unclassified Leptolyngbya TaxID=2650499 RepID=UPI001685328F|nr:hypothetical protein [Leptolyngbya sp. FACHB-16]MBD2157151.1 hypothetical protein [Leptolyngbya sp. FACHB-16]
MVRSRSSASTSTSTGVSRLWLGIISTVISFPLISSAFDAFTWNRAEQAYQDAQCEQAIASYKILSERWRPVDWQDYKTRSESRINECSGYQAVLPELEGRSLTKGVVAANLFFDRFPNSALIPPLRQQVTSRLEATTPDTLATAEFCDALPSTLGHSLLPRPDQMLPALRHACGEVYQTAGRYNEAIDQLQRFLTDYPNHEQASAVEVALAKTLIDQARANNAGDLPSPVIDGRAAAGTTKVQIRNDSPEPMRIVFTGPETRFEELPGCRDCQVFTATVPQSCPEKGPIATYTLKPGDYQVLVRSIGDRSVTPFTGEWSLLDGYQHSNCFYIVQQPVNTDQKPLP